MTKYRVKITMYDYYVALGDPDGDGSFLTGDEKKATAFDSLSELIKGMQRIALQRGRPIVNSLIIERLEEIPKPSYSVSVVE